MIQQPTCMQVSPSPVESPNSAQEENMITFSFGPAAGVPAAASALNNDCQMYESDNHNNKMGSANHMLLMLPNSNSSNNNTPTSIVSPGAEAAHHRGGYIFFPQGWREVVDASPCSVDELAVFRSSTQTSTDSMDSLNNLYLADANNNTLGVGNIGARRAGRGASLSPARAKSKQTSLRKKSAENALRHPRAHTVASSGPSGGGSTGVAVVGGGAGAIAGSEATLTQAELLELSLECMLPGGNLSPNQQQQQQVQQRGIVATTNSSNALFTAAHGQMASPSLPPYHAVPQPLPLPSGGGGLVGSACASLPVQRMASVPSAPSVSVARAHSLQCVGEGTTTNNNNSGVHMTYAQWQQYTTELASSSPLAHQPQQQRGVPTRIPLPPRAQLVSANTSRLGVRRHSAPGLFATTAPPTQQQHQQGGVLSASSPQARALVMAQQPFNLPAGECLKRLFLVRWRMLRCLSHPPPNLRPSTPLLLSFALSLLSHDICRSALLPFP